MHRPADELPVPPEGPLPVGSGRGEWSPRPPTDAEAKALASGLRIQVIRLCLHEALTNKEIAEALGRPPASVLHHVRTLVATGFLVPDPPRTGRRGAREVPYRASGKSFAMSDGSAAGASAVLQAFLTELDGVPDRDVSIGRVGLQLSPADLDELRDALDDVLREFARRPADPDGERWSLHTVLHPEARRVSPPGPPARRARRRGTPEA